MARSRFKVLLLVLLMALTGLVSLTPVAAQDNIIHITALSDVRTVDPHIAYEFDTWTAVGMFYQGLVGLSDDNNPVPALADSWTVNDEGTVYTFTLAEGVKFSNGREITPEDVKYSFERLLNPETASPTAFMFETLVGTPEYQSGAASEVSGIRIVDGRTVEFTFALPNWTMLKRFALPPGSIIAKEGVEAAENFGREPLGAGPFVLDSWETGIRVTGSRNPNYWREGYPKADGFDISIGIEPSTGVLRMESGEADASLDPVSNADYPRLSADPVLASQLVRLAAFPNTDYVIFNTNIEPFNNIDVRHALDMAIDRERLITINNKRATISNGMVPPIVPGNSDGSPTAYDPAAAKAALTAAGYPDGFSTQLLSTTDPQQQSVAQAIIADWAAIGVQAELVAIDNSQFVDLLVNQPDQVQAVMTQWYNDYLDPSNNYEPLLKCGGSYNWGRHCNDELDAKFEAANLLPPGDERWAAFAELEALVHEDAANLYLYHLDTYYFTSARITLTSNPALLLRFDEATLQ